MSSRLQIEQDGKQYGWAGYGRPRAGIDYIQDMCGSVILATGRLEGERTILRLVTPEAPEPKATIEQGGKRYEFDHYGSPARDVWYLNNHRKELIQSDGSFEHHRQLAIFCPVPEVPVRHTFGGIVFEETDHICPLTLGMWGLIDGRLKYWSGPGVSSMSFQVLRPVGLQ